MQQPKSRFLLFTAVGAVLLAGALLLAGQLPAGSGGETCIGCHVEQYNRGISSQFQHQPFWDRQCSVCHLEPGSRWDEQQSSSQNITGELVTQELIWGKQRSISNELLSKTHFFNIDHLNSTAGYRFRLLVGYQPDRAIAKGAWLGLDPRELWNSQGHELICTNGLEGEIGAHINTLTISAISTSTAVISWQTNQPLFSWVEVQDLEGVNLREGVTAAESDEPTGHPPLRSREDLAIEACYQCHPQATLGTSHPVRLYGGRDVRIPDELPTVDGMMTCVTCHDPHGGKSHMLVRTLIKTKLCVTCHYKYKNSSPSTMFRD